MRLLGQTAGAARARCDRPRARCAAKHLGEAGAWALAKNSFSDSASDSPSAPPGGPRPAVPSARL
eukprot:8785421-Pyramimonas_sp.AAC.1